METDVSGHGLGLAYANDPIIIEGLDQERVFEDLAEATTDALVFRPERWRLADHEHVVLARASRSGRYLGLLGASTEQVAGETILHIETAFVTPQARLLDFFQRMLALVVLRMEGADAAPAVIAACTGSTACLTALHRIQGRCPGAVLFPETDRPVVSLAAAALARAVAQRIVPRRRLEIATGRIYGPREQVLAVLDLRGCPSGSVVEAARARCRARPSGAAWRAALGEPPQTARRTAER